jgi:hypothetical protein
MRFGTQIVMVEQDGLVMTKEEKYYNWSTVQKITKMSESVRIKSIEQAHAEFLKLMDKYKQGEVLDFGIECITSKNGQLDRVEKTWTVVDLRST